MDVDEDEGVPLKKKRKNVISDIDGDTLPELAGLGTRCLPGTPLNSI